MSIAASMASSRISGPIMVSISTYLGGRELMNFLTIVLSGVLFCGFTCLYIFLNRVVYLKISSSSLCSKLSYFQVPHLYLDLNFESGHKFWHEAMLLVCSFISMLEPMLVIDVPFPGIIFEESLYDF